MEYSVSIEALLESGAHFGHLTRRWNPKMAPFIFMERNGIHIIDLRKTQILLDVAKSAVYDIASKGRIVLFVGTKNQAKTTIAEQATRAGVNYVSERWLGGMLTNFVTIRKSVKRLNAIDKMEIDGTFEKITKKERLLITREKERLRRVFGGVESLTRLPGALFVVDIRKEHLAIKEAKILGIPVIGVVDTNTDPDLVDFPIPANDDSLKTIEIIASVMADAVLEGSEIAKIRQAELKAEGHHDKDGDSEGDDKKSKRRIRERRVKRTDKRRSPQSEADTNEKDDNKSESNKKEDTANTSDNN